MACPYAKHCVSLSLESFSLSLSAQERESYAGSWDAYIDGHIVSESSRRYITNLLAATAAMKTEDSHDSSEDSDAEKWRHLDMRAGSMDVVQRTLQGIAAAMRPEARMKAFRRWGGTLAPSV